MFNTKTLTASLLTLAACATEPAVELAPGQAAEALTTAQSLGIVTKGTVSNWVVMATIPLNNPSQDVPQQDGPMGDDKSGPDEEGEGAVTPEPDAELPESSPGGGNADKPQPEAPSVLEGVYKTYIAAIDEAAFGIEKGPSENFEIIREDEGYRVNGFVTVHRGGDAETINHFYGHGRAIFVQPETGCEIEWSRNIEGILGDEGAAEANVRDHALYLDPDCAPEGTEGGAAFASYRIELSKIGMGPQ